MKDFLKKLKERLENRPAPPFEEADWLALERRLDAASQTKKRPAAAWFFLPLFLASLGGNVFLFQKLKNPAAKTASADLSASHDTIYIYTSRIEQRTDTIFKTRVVQQPVFLSQNFAAADLKTDSFSFQKNQNAAAADLKTGGFSFQKNQNTAATDLKTDKIDFEKIPTLPLAPLILDDFPKISGTATPPYHFKKRRSFQQTVYAFRPKSVRFGAAGGWTIPISSGVENRNGYSLGGEMQVGFSPSLRFWADANYFQWQFVADRMDETLGIPKVAPPSDDFQFKKADAVQPSLHFSMGLEYVFRAEKSFRPFLGIGLGAAKRFSYNVDYEFLDPATGIEWNFDQTVGSPATLSNFFVGRAGAVRSLPRGWEISARFDFRQPLGGGQIPAVFGVQTGVFKKF